MYDDMVLTLASHGAMFDGGSEASRLKIAAEWESEFDPETADAWMRAGCWDAATAADLRDAGFVPGEDELRFLCGGRAPQTEPMYALCNGDCRLADVQF